jgi:hypothetical protein
MESKTNKQPYQPPQITRVVLKKEQSILSQCSFRRTSASASGSKCINAGCRRSTSGSADNSIVS